MLGISRFIVILTGIVFGGISGVYAQASSMNQLKIADQMISIERLENACGRIKLMTQQRFLPLNEQQNEGSYTSLSNQREPDYIIGIFDQDDILKSWVVLDAKFRTNQHGVHEGMGKIHIYRDSLRWNGKPPDAGYAIIPKTVSRTERYTTEEYRTKHNFGLLICPLTPEPDWLAPVTMWLKNTLGGELQ